MGLPFSNLRVRFLILVLVAVLPALGLLIVTASEQRDSAVADTQETTRRLARFAAADQSRLLERTHQILSVLGRLPEVRTGGPACDSLFAGLLTEFPQYANLGVVDPNGQLICSGIQPPEEIDLSGRGYIQEAIATRAYAVGEYQVGVVTGARSLNCGLPIVDGDTLIGVVYAALDLNWLSDFSGQAEIAEGAVVTVYDRTGTVLARSADRDAWIGRALAGTTVVDKMLTEGSGVAQADDETGASTLYAFAPLGNGTAPAAYLSIAIPRETAEQSANDAFNRSLTRLGLVLAVVLVAAWVGGDLLVRRDTEANKALVRRVYDAFHTGGVDPLDEIVAPNFVDHSPSPGQTQGLAGLKQAVGLFRAAFPDGEMTVNDLMAERNQVMARVTLCGTHTGVYAGVPPSGHYVSAEGIETFRIKRGKIVEGWSWFGPLRIDEPGYTPAPETSAANESD